MDRHVDDILPARRPAARWQVPLLAAATAALGAAAFVLAVARSVD